MSEIITPDQDIESSDQFTGWYGFDTENDKDGKVTIAALIHESGAKHIWRHAGGFAKWCDTRKLGDKPMVICHNLEYDLVNEFGPRYGDLQLNYLKGRLISAKLGRVTFRDSFNHFRMSLKTIGKAIGVDKKDMDIYSEEYVTTDSWICLKVMADARDYIAGLGGKMGATSGSSAMSVWRYMTEDEYCTGPYDTPWLRKGYFGGRTEIFRPHTTGRAMDKLNPSIAEERQAFLHARENFAPYAEDIRGYDINSQYPFCMLNDFPENILEDNGAEKAKGMAEVTIRIPTDLHVAPLPYRDANGCLLYPVGIIRGVWSYDEIRLAESLGAKILTVHQGYGCNVVHRPFDQFINTLYKKRKASTSEAETLFLKVLMNSLYGKIASKNVVTRTVSRHSLLKKNSSRLEEVKWITYHRGLLDYYTPQQPYVNVLWGSMITAYARILLAKHLLKVPAEKLIYCDTDSLYVINHTMPESKELGEVKLEKRASVMKVVQPKAYQLDEFYKAKGVPKAKYGDDGQILVDYAKQYIEDGFTEFQAPIRFRASLNSKRGKANQWVDHSKAMRTAYKHKRLCGDRYLPPIIEMQTELFSVQETKQMKQRKKKKE